MGYRRAINYERIKLWELDNFGDFKTLCDRDRIVRKILLNINFARLKFVRNFIMSRVLEKSRKSLKIGPMSLKTF